VSVLVRFEAVDRRDVWMIESGQGSRLALKAGQRLGIGTGSKPLALGRILASVSCL
jgi:hypothetical protein